MAKSKYSFEKRQREKARQKKQEDKVARRREAKLLKTETESEIQNADPGISGMESVTEPVLENTGNTNRSEEESR